MADSDKDILITPNTGVASTHPKITFTGKDNSPVDLKILDDNTLSFEGAQGQVFSISPTLNSGDIFSVNDISGIQSIAVNADGTITMNAQTQETTIKSSVSNAASLVIENDNNDGNAGPILDLFRNPQDHTVASGDLIGKIAFKGLFYDGSDYDQIKEWASITSEIEHYQGDGSVSFNVLQNGSSTAYLKVNGNTQDIVFNDGSSNDFDVRIESDNDANNFFSDGSAGRIGIGTNAPAAKLHVDAGATVAPSLTFGATAGQILQNENSELAIGLDNDSPYSLWLQARTSGNAARDISLQPLGGKIGIGTESPASKLHVIGGANDEVVALFTTAGGTSSSVEGIAHIGLSHFSTDTAPSVSISAEEIDDGDHRADFRINTRTSASSNATPTEKMRVTSAGHVLIGTTSYSGTSSHAGLEVSHGTQANLRVTDSSASASSDFAQSENDLYIVNRKSGGNIRMRVGGSTETILMDSDGDIKFANGATSSWATWNSVVFSRHSYGTASGSGAGLYVEDNGTNTFGGHNIPFTAKIRAVAFHFGGSSVDFTSTSNNSWNIFRAGQTSDSFATVTFNNGQGTRLQSGGSDTNHMYYVVTGLNISVAAGDTIHLRRESGTTNVGNVRIEIFYSHV